VIAPAPEHCLNVRGLVWNQLPSCKTATVSRSAWDGSVPAAMAMAMTS